MGHSRACYAFWTKAGTFVKWSWAAILGLCPRLNGSRLPLGTLRHAPAELNYFGTLYKNPQLLNGPTKQSRVELAYPIETKRLPSNFLPLAIISLC
jgi:hypothetical protein